MSAQAPPTLTLPPGRAVELPGRGSTFIRELRGPRNAPTLVLLHGLGVDADLNWFPSFAELGRSYRVVAIDHRGHGQGIALRGERFRLADCADDVAALCDALGLDRVIPVGYSMGGPIAQLLWHRHRDLVAGLVLCATAARFPSGPLSKAATGLVAPLSAAARFSTRALPSNPITRTLVAARIDDPGMRQWIQQRERSSNPRAVIEAALAISRFDSTTWLGGVDVPSAVLVTRFDRLVPRNRQQELVRLMSTATEHPVMGDHSVCVSRPDLFLPGLLAACRAVTGDR